MTTASETLLPIGAEHPVFYNGCQLVTRFTQRSPKKANVSNVLPMAFDPRQRRAALQSFLETHNLRPWALINAAKTSESVVRGFLAGRSTSITDKSYEKLAAGASLLLGRRVTADELRGEVSQRADLAIDSFVAGDGTVDDYDADDPREYVFAPEDVRDGGAAIVNADAQPGALEPGDILMWPKPDSDVAACLGKIALVKIKNGPRVIRRLMRGRNRHRFHLFGLASTAAPLEDRHVEWAAPIRWIRRR